MLLHCCRVESLCKTQMCAQWLNLHILETVEPFVHLHIIPLDGADLVEAVDGGQCVDDMRAQEGVDVVRGEFGTARPVLGPVCHVTHQFTG